MPFETQPSLAEARASAIAAEVGPGLFAGATGEAIASVSRTPTSDPGPEDLDSAVRQALKEMWRAPVSDVPRGEAPANPLLEERVAIDFSLQDLVRQRHLEQQEGFPGGNADPRVSHLVEVACRTRSGRAYKSLALPACADQQDQPEAGPLPAAPVVGYKRTRDKPSEPPEKAAPSAAPSIPAKRPAPSDPESEGAHKKKRCRHSRKGGKGSAATKEVRDQRHLQIRAEARGEETYAATHGLLVQKLRITKPGWMGNRFPVQEAKRLIEAWRSGEIVQALKGFQQVPFDDALSRQPPTYIQDKALNTLLARSALENCMEVSDTLRADFDHDSEVFVGEWAAISRADIEGNSRGNHLFCIAGYHRNIKKEPGVTPWTVRHQKALDHFFRAGGPADRITKLGCQFVRRAFPGVAFRFEKCAKTLEAQYGFKPAYDLFYNYCLNFPSQEVLRVYCEPHVDWKNVALGVCLLFIHGKFDHRERAWLVLWEAGIIIQIPPGVFVAYPSSLFFHFNFDRFVIVTTPDGKLPTRETAEPLDGRDGRRSSVWFNQASLIQTAELGYPTVGAAKKAGLAGTCNVRELLEKGIFTHPPL
ncbi:hypothetical protein DENSPDRAFT_887108 [Dentipellis sp. KUC8613]|nr:hypothetical protein DENSPDRAFT_887108 [Dentipellis sp. KUC8613]